MENLAPNLLPRRLAAQQTQVRRVPSENREKAAGSVVFGMFVQHQVATRDRSCLESAGCPAIGKRRKI